MRGRGTGETDSMDLLLDTMCNAFGGIVFIALLLVIIAQSLGDPQQQKPDASTTMQVNEQMEQQLQMAALASQKSILEMALSLQEEADSLDVDVGARESQEDLRRLSNDNESLTDAVRELEEQIKVAEEKSASAKEDAAASEDVVSTISREVAELQTKIAKAKKTEQRDLRLPRRQKTNKTPFFVGLRNGKFYCISSLRGRGYDSEDVWAEEGPLQTIVTLKDDAGQMVVEGSEGHGKLARLLRELDPKRYFVDFAIHTNSFSQMLKVRDALLERGFNYEWGVISGRSLNLVAADEVYAQ